MRCDQVIGPSEKIAVTEPMYTFETVGLIMSISFPSSLSARRLLLITERAGNGELPQPLNPSAGAV